MSVFVSAEDDVTNAVEFQFLRISQSLFNVLRHAVFKDVRVLGVDTVTFLEYDGPLESEMVSHRIGQLPLRFTHRAPFDATEASFEICVHAPPASTKRGLTWVTSTDVVCTAGDAEVVHYRSTKEQAVAADDKGFMLVPLHPGQRLHVKIQARVSTGREAARWVSCHVRARTEPYRLRVETTGAITAREAMTLALRETLHRLRDFSVHLNS